MGKANFSDEFKRGAVVQITERGYPIAEVAPRLGASQHSCMPGIGNWRRWCRAMPARMRRSAS